jgi:hypothetical protein
MSHADHGRSEPPETLASTANGSLTRCTGCGALELRFGNALLRFDATDLPQVCEAVQSSARLRRDRASRIDVGDQRYVELHMGDSGAGFVFSYNEIRELDDLLAIATRRIASESAISDSPLATDDDFFIPEPILRRLKGIRHGRS